MGIFSDKKISSILNKKGLVIHPYENKNLTGIGYDLTTGILSPLSKIEEFNEDDDFYYIPAKSYFVIISKEFVWLSSKMAGTLHARGTLAAKGLYTNCTNIDPNFKGQLIMSMYNVSEKSVKIGKTETYITMILHNLKKPTKTLVGDEGSKNSMRVIKQFEEIYGEDNKLVNRLHKFLTESNGKNQHKFEELVSDSKSNSIFKKINLTGSLKKIFSIRFLMWVILTFIIIVLVIQIVVADYKSNSFDLLFFSTKVVILLGVMIGLIDKLKKPK